MLRAWLLSNGLVPQQQLPRTDDFETLKHHLLDNALITHHQLGHDETEPFVMGTDFYGSTLDEAIDTLPEPTSA
jgi:hypothetical protein